MKTYTQLPPPFTYVRVYHHEPVGMFLDSGGDVIYGDMVKVSRDGNWEKDTTLSFTIYELERILEQVKKIISE